MTIIPYLHVSQLSHINYHSFSNPYLSSPHHTPQFTKHNKSRHPISSPLPLPTSSPTNNNNPHQPFEEKQQRSEFPPSHAIISLSKSGEHLQALHLFKKLSAHTNHGPDEFSLCRALTACASSKVVEFGKAIHGRTIKDGMLGMTIVSNSLVTFYSKIAYLEDSVRVFETTERKDIVSWNAVIAGNEQNGSYEIAVSLFQRLIGFELLLKPNRVTYLSVLSTISSTSALNHGREVHAQMVRSGLDLETSIANSLITMYGKCGKTDDARLVFDGLLHRDVISWNSMLAGYEQNKQMDCCFNLLREMQLSGFDPDNHSLTIIASAASSSNPAKAIYKRLCREIHCYAFRRGATGSCYTCNAIIAMYANNNRLQDAEKIFKRMRIKDSYTWNVMMDGYSTNGFFNESMTLFIDMHKQGLQSDHLAFSILLTVCARLASLQMGKQFHAFLIKRCHHVCKTPSSQLSLDNALISMYSKCGCFRDADKLFQRMEMRDVFSWTAMITCYAHQGMASKSLALFESMKAENVHPNSVTFLGILTACAHAGLVEEGKYYFDSMSSDYDVKLNLEHYACMVDMFGRLGQFEGAVHLIQTGQMWLKEHESGSCLSLWKVLLGACHMHKRLDLGVHSATKILDMDPNDETTHVLLSNIYSSFGLWEDAIRIRKSMKDKGLKKEAGISWIEVERERHVFVAGDVCHPSRGEIYEKLEELENKCKRIGYVPMTEYVIHDVDELQKEDIIRCHSEKLAVSFGLIRSKATRVIRVIKNLRVCRDCHNWMKFISLVEDREIILRDPRRFHCFKDGKCSCGDYW